MISKSNPINTSIPDAAMLLGISRASLYRLIAEGDIKTIKVRRRRLVPYKAILDYQAAQIRKYAA